MHGRNRKMQHRELLGMLWSHLICFGMLLAEHILGIVSNTRNYTPYWYKKACNNLILTPKGILFTDTVSDSVQMLLYNT